MNGWHEIWSHKHPLWVKILFKYLLPIAGILFFIYINYHVYTNILPKANVYGGIFGIGIRYLVFLVILIVIFLISRLGFRPQIKIYKEGAWLNSNELNIFGYKIKTKWSRPEKWLEWKDIEKLSIYTRVRFEKLDILYINIVTKDQTYPIILDPKEAIALRDAVKRAGQEDKLK